MIFGDFNARHYSWNCSKTNKAGNVLYALQQTNNFMIFYPAEHTHHPHSGQTPSTIDLVLANVNFYFELTALAGHLSSDHNPIVCQIDEFIKVSSKKMFDYSKANWNGYRKIITDSIHSLTEPVSSYEIEQSIDNFSKLVLDAQTQNILTKSTNTHSSISSNTKQMI